MDIQKITEEDASPLVLKIKSGIIRSELDKTLYMNWKVRWETNLSLVENKLSKKFILSYCTTSVWSVENICWESLIVNILLASCQQFCKDI